MRLFGCLRLIFSFLIFVLDAKNRGFFGVPRFEYIQGNRLTFATK